MDDGDFINPLSGIGTKVKALRAFNGFQIMVRRVSPSLPPNFPIFLVVPVSGILLVAFPSAGSKPDTFPALAGGGSDSRLALLRWTIFKSKCGYGSSVLLSPGVRAKKKQQIHSDFLPGGAAGGRPVFSFESLGQAGPMMDCSINGKL